MTSRHAGEILHVLKKLVRHLVIFLFLGKSIHNIYGFYYLLRLLMYTNKNYCFRLKSLILHQILQYRLLIIVMLTLKSTMQ